MKKYLVLEQSTMALFDYLKKQNYPGVFLEKFVCLNSNKFLRAIRKFIFFHTSLKKIFCFKWWKLLNDIDVVICFDSIYALDICKLIKRDYPQKRIILYYWNSINESIKFQPFLDLECEIWTYDYIQAKENGFVFNDTFLVDFYCDLMPEYSRITKSNKNVFYIGKDKDRTNIIKKCIKIFDGHDVTYDFVIVSNNRLIKNKCVEYRHSHVDYFDMLKTIHSYDCVLDINSPLSTGMTLRPLEALYSRKKLITTNLNIMDSVLYRYNSENIFVLGKDNPSDLFGFVNSGFVSPSDEVFDYYSFQGWVNRFNV